MRQVSELCTLLLRYNMIQHHPLGPVQGRWVLRQLHTVIQQGATYIDHSKIVCEECNMLSQPWWLMNTNDFILVCWLPPSCLVAASWWRPTFFELLWRSYSNIFLLWDGNIFHPAVRTRGNPGRAGNRKYILASGAKLRILNTKFH